MPDVETVAVDMNSAWVCSVVANRRVGYIPRDSMMIVGGIRWSVRGD